MARSREVWLEADELIRAAVRSDEVSIYADKVRWWRLWLSRSVHCSLEQAWLEVNNMVGCSIIFDKEDKHLQRRIYDKVWKQVVKGDGGPSSGPSSPTSWGLRRWTSSLCRGRPLPSMGAIV